MARGEVAGQRPVGETGNLEMVERAVPGFDGVAGEDGIPIQAVDGEAAMVDGGKQLSDANAVNVSLRAEINARKFHGDASPDAAAEGQCREVGDVEAVFAETISASAAQAALMKDVVRQENIGGGVVAGAGKFAAGESAFAAHVNFAGWGERGAKDLAEVNKIDPSAVAILPKRRDEGVHC